MVFQVRLWQIGFVFAPKIQTATCHVPNTHGASVPKPRFSGRQPRRPEPQNATQAGSGILGFSRENAVSGNELGMVSGLRDGLAGLANWVVVQRVAPGPRGSLKCEV
jgi:hypothetical protein